ncbi:MAG: hypothetical protein QF464_18210, partial [Myxococcota bacterium]|nr:hypothetical protein [Myxococcota bacterium]
MRSRLLVLLTLASCAWSCAREPVEAEVATVEAPAPPPVVVPAPPPPTEPAYSSALDAAIAEGGVSGLDADLGAFLRAMQHEAGERPAVLTAGDWDDRVDVVVATAAELPEHAVAPDAPMRTAIERLKVLRSEIIAFG